VNTAVAAAVTELFIVTSREAGSPFIVLAQYWRLKSRKTSRSRPCKVSVSVSSRGKNQTSRSRLSLVELQEGLGLGLVSDQKPNASVS